MSANTFSIESNSKTTEDVGKLNTTLSYGSRWKTQHNAFLWVALENSTQRFPMGRVGKLNTTLSYGSRCGAGTSFTEDLS
ncbi:hypothetical protein ACLK3H_12530 [Leptospira interrogans]|uniref:hypothetical protein n=1 Tax=Leptospira interrogans TaxID=173 RepID=UPI00398A8507